MRVVSCVMVLCCLTMPGCTPAALREVRHPREGVPAEGRLCIVYSQGYQIDLGGFERLHRFDIHKYAHIYRQLVKDGLIEAAQVHVPEPISEQDLRRVHTDGYLQRLRRPAYVARYLELAPAALLPASVIDAGILAPFRHATGGTLKAARLALEHGMAVNLGGGYHHAEPDRGGGFCIYADMPIAVRVLQAEGRIRRALIVDLDVHQGNGTAVCFAGDDDVFTFDMYEEGIYPMPKQPVDLDVPLPAGVGDEEYLDLLARHLPEAFDRARPDLMILQAGVDSLAGDPLANMRLTPQGIVRRDCMVFAEAGRRQVPIVMVLGGGYSKQAWRAQYASIRHLVEHHAASACPE
jgi:histone deacetylase 11